MKLITWNCNGINAKNRITYIEDTILKIHKPDILGLVETKLQEHKTPAISNYPFVYFNYSTSTKGYSGTALLSKIKPKNVVFDPFENSACGRCIFAEYEKFNYLLVYVPNVGQKLEKLKYRTSVWDKQFKQFVLSIIKKPLIITGDLNVINREIDVHTFNTKKNGMTPEERANFHDFLEKSKMVDSYILKNPMDIRFTYFSYQPSILHNKHKNNGHRNDYFLVSENLKSKVQTSSSIDNIKNTHGSDHDPILLKIKI